MIVLLLTTKNEADVLRLNLEHHLAYGVDHIAVCDNESTDDTQDVVRSFGDAVSTVVFHDFYERQRHRTECVERLKERFPGQIEWIGVSDTDEFFWRPGQTLPEVLAEVPADVPAATFHQKLFVPTVLDPADGPVYARQLYRTGNYETPLHKSYREGKTFYRPSWLRRVDHEHRSPKLTGPEWTTPDPLVHHYMIRDEDQFVMKVVRLTAWRPRKGLRSKLWYHKLRAAIGIPDRPFVAGFKAVWWDVYRQGGEAGLREYYRSEFCVQAADIERHVAAGDLVKDDAFAAFRAG